MKGGKLSALGLRTGELEGLMKERSQAFRSQADLPALGSGADRAKERCLRPGKKEPLRREACKCILWMTNKYATTRTQNKEI